MVRNLQIRRWLCATLVLPLAIGPAFAAEGVIVGVVGPGCPVCNVPGGPPCPANVKYFGYYPTRWRRWPGTQPTPVEAPPSEQNPPNRVEVPPPEQEGVGKPGGTSGDTGGANPSSGPTTDPTSPNPSANPNATPPNTAAPMLNGLPLPNALPLPNTGRLPNGATVPGAPFQNGVPQPNGALPPNGGSIPGGLPAPEQPDPAAKGSQLFAPAQTPLAVSVTPVSNEPVKLNQALTEPALPTTAPAAIETQIGQTITPVSAPAPTYQWPPANVLRSSTVRAGFQVPVEPSVRKGSNSDAAAWIEPLPPLGAHALPPRSVPSNSLRIDMPPPPAQAPLANTANQSPQPTIANAAHDSKAFDRSNDNALLLIVAERPARPASISADDRLSEQANTHGEAQIPAADDTMPNARTSNASTVRFSLDADQPPSQFVHPASWIDRSQPAIPASDSSMKEVPSEGQPVHAIVNPFRGPIVAPTVNSPGNPTPPNWSALNSPATLAPLYKSPAMDRPLSGASNNSPGAIAAVANRSAAESRSAGEIRFSPLRDAVVNVRISADEAASTSMSAIDPLQIGRAMADDQQPAMKALPIQNALPTTRFEPSDYVSQDRCVKPAAYSSAPQPVPSGPAFGTRRIMDPAVQTASFQQAVPGAAPNLGAIDPLEVARSLGTTPAPSFSALPPLPAANAGVAAAPNSPQSGR